MKIFHKKECITSTYLIIESESEKCFVESFLKFIFKYDNYKFVYEVSGGLSASISSVKPILDYLLKDGDKVLFIGKSICTDKTSIIDEYYDIIHEMLRYSSSNYDVPSFVVFSPSIEEEANSCGFEYNHNNSQKKIEETDYLKLLKSSAFDRLLSLIVGDNQQNMIINIEDLYKLCKNNNSVISSVEHCLADMDGLLNGRDINPLKCCKWFDGSFNYRIADNIRMNFWLSPQKKFIRINRIYKS